MRPTREWIEERLRHFNDLCFDGKLPPVPVRLTVARSYLGQIAYVRRRTITGKTVCSDFIMRISTCFDLDRRVIEDTLLHEMIHYAILSGQIRDDAPHGTRFRMMMNEINRRHGRHITVTHRLTADEHASDGRRQHHLLCLSRLSDGTFGITRAARSRLFEIWDRLPALPVVVDVCWIWTTDHYFNRLPRSLRPAVYRTSPADIIPHLAAAHVLERHGNTVHAGAAFDAVSFFERRDAGVK